MDNSTWPNIEIKETKRGKGLFASQDIPANTFLFKIHGKELSFAECVALGENENYCLQIEREKYILPHFPFFLSNHSCNPNCGIKKELEFTTIRPVKKGEELRWDYSTSMLERHWTLNCECGEKNCRKKITDFDLLPRSLQHRYIKKGIVMPYILEFLGYK
jgi:SET domain-containing protein